MSTLEEKLKRLEFPNLEDESTTLGYGEATYGNAYDMVVAMVGDGFDYRRTNKTKVTH